jgi:hypothetical protein
VKQQKREQKQKKERKFEFVFVLVFVAKTDPSSTISLCIFEVFSKKKKQK